MCHSVQYKEGIFLDVRTNMAISDQKMMMVLSPHIITLFLWRLPKEQIKNFENFF